MNAYLSLTLVALISLGTSPVLAKTPLKVYILAGQSNMEGQARVRTISAMRGDPEVTELYKDMTDANGNPVTVDNVHIVYGDRSGKLNATFGAANRGPKIGPEYTFGIYMAKSLKEPILLIKTAWGGKDLIQQFRPPSAGELEKKTDKDGKETGHYYREMIKQVKDVLTDPGKYHPAYDEDAGYEVAGFVWFQGFKEQFGSYPKLNPEDKRSAKDFSEYGRVLAHFIRDIRKDLSAPEMNFVIGAVGFDGVVATEHENRLPRSGANWVMLQRAQAAPAAMPEFKDNVAAVYTGKCWDHKLAAAAGKIKWVNKKMGRRYRDGVKKGSPKAKEIRARYMKQKDVTEEEQAMMKGVSDGTIHYLGSAKIYGRIGKAFAEAMLALGQT